MYEGTLVAVAGLDAELDALTAPAHDTVACPPWPFTLVTTAGGSLGEAGKIVASHVMSSRAMGSPLKETLL